MTTINVKEIEELSAVIRRTFILTEGMAFDAADALDALLAFYKESVEQEPFIVDEPAYSYEAMGCGLEDRNITDRYEAMKHGWDCAVERMFEQIPKEPLYALPPASAYRIAELEAKYTQADEGWQAMSRYNQGKDAELAGAKQQIQEQAEKLRIAREALEGMISIDEMHCDRGYGDQDISSEVKAAYKALAALGEE